MTNWIDILILIPIIVASLLPVIPPTWAGLSKTYFDTFYQMEKEQKKLNSYELIIHLISHIIITGPALSLGFKGTVTLILFIILSADLYLNHQISNNAVILSIIGILTLYLEKLIDTASELTIWKVFTWKSKSNQTLVAPTPLNIKNENIPIISESNN